MANKQIVPRAHAAMFEYMQSVPVLENIITFCHVAFSFIGNSTLRSLPLWERLRVTES